MASVPPTDSPWLPPPRRRRRWWPTLSELALALAAFTLANALAILFLGPPAGAPEGRPGRLVLGGDEFATPAARATAEALERMRKTLIVLTFNTVAVVLLGFGLIARWLEARRRIRLGLPEWIDEHALQAHAERPASQAASSGQYRPSLN